MLFESSPVGLHWVAQLPWRCFYLAQQLKHDDVGGNPAIGPRWGRRLAGGFDSDMSENGVYRYTYKMAALITMKFNGQV